MRHLLGGLVDNAINRFHDVRAALALGGGTGHDLSTGKDSKRTRKVVATESWVMEQSLML